MRRSAETPLRLKYNGPRSRSVMECAGRAGAATALSPGETWTEGLCASVPKRCRAQLATAVQNGATRHSGAKAKAIALRRLKWRTRCGLFSQHQ